jgi:hypothetical protein
MLFGIHTRAIELSLQLRVSPKMKLLSVVILLAPFAVAAAEPLFPTAEGTTWNYELIQERTSDALDLTEPNEKEHFAVTYRLGGIQKIDNKDLRRFEVYRGSELDSVDLIAIEQNGIACPARTDAKGAIIRLLPPQMMLETPLQKGTRWKFDGTIGTANVNQQYEISGEEDVDVPAGKFRAWRIHCEQTSPAPATIDRWFVPGTGFVKVVTAVKGESGIALQKNSLNLKERPKVEAVSRKNQASYAEKLSAEVSNESNGAVRDNLKVDAPAIYARWHGRGLPAEAKVRAVFIAENVADVTADYQIDEIETTAPAPNSGGTFTLSQPEGGWAPGNYRLEFYVDDTLAQTVKFKIVK